MIPLGPVASYPLGSLQLNLPGITPQPPTLRSDRSIHTNVARNGSPVATTDPRPMIQCRLCVSVCPQPGKFLTVPQTCMRCMLCNVCVVTAVRGCNSFVRDRQQKARGARAPKTFGRGGVLFPPSLSPTARRRGNMWSICSKGLLLHRSRPVQRAVSATISPRPTRT